MVRLNLLKKVSAQSIKVGHSSAQCIEINGIKLR